MRYFLRKNKSKLACINVLQSTANLRYFIFKYILLDLNIFPVINMDFRTVTPECIKYFSNNLSEFIRSVFKG